MGLHSRRRDSSSSAIPPLSPSLPTISIPPPVLHHLEPSLDPFPPQLFDSANFQPKSAKHSRRDSLPGPSSLPLSPPSTYVRSRRDSYPGPFPDLPASPPSSDPPPPVHHVRHETCPIPFPQIVGNESDLGFLPSTSTSSIIPYHHSHDLYSFNKRRTCLYDKDNGLVWPFGELKGVDHEDIRETAYEIFFTACRSSPGFGGRSALTFYSKNENAGSMSPSVSSTLMSRVKLALGLRMMRSSLSQRMTSAGEWPSTPSSPSPSPSSVVERSPKSCRAMPRRQMTMAEVMRIQMGVSEQSDSRLRKTLMRTLVGQVS